MDLAFLEQSLEQTLVAKDDFVQEVCELLNIQRMNAENAKMQTEAKEYDTYARQDPYSSPMKSSIPSSTVVALFPEVATKRLVDNPQKHN